MSHKLFRIEDTLKNQPHYISEEGFRSILEYVNSRNYDKDFSIATQVEAEEWSKEAFNVENGIALFSIDGPLSYRYSWISALCGLTTYQGLLADAKEAISQGAHTFVLDIHSPGGMAHGCFEYASEFKRLAKENDINIIAYVDGVAASAAYAWASISDRLIINPNSEVGSVGVLIKIENDLPKEIKEGTEVIFVYAGNNKVPYDTDGTLRKDFLEKLQESVDESYVEFTSFIAEQRNLSVEDVVATQADTFRGQKAIDIGFADEMMTTFEFIDYLADISESRESNMPLNLFGTKRDKQLSKSPSGESPEDIKKEENLESSEVKPEEEEGNENMSDANLTQEQVQEMISQALQQKEAEMSAEKEKLVQELTEMKQAKYKEHLSSVKETLKSFSFVNEGAGLEDLASFLVDNEGSKEAVAVMEALNAAQVAVEAGLDLSVGGEGERLDDDYAAVSSINAKLDSRFNKQ